MSWSGPWWLLLASLIAVGCSFLSCWLPHCGTAFLVAEIILCGLLYFCAALLCCCCFICACDVQMCGFGS